MSASCATRCRRSGSSICRFRRTWSGPSHPPPAPISSCTSWRCTMASSAENSAKERKQAMIYELRTYTFHQGKLPAYLALARDVGRPVRGQDYGTCHGYWTAEFGALNQVWHMWSYSSLDERAKMRDALAQNPR